MAWRSVEVEEQRVRFVVAASRGERRLTELCSEFGISRPTGYLWLERYRAGGVAAVAAQSRRPHSSPSRTAVETEQRIAALRRERPDWGARKLAVLLANEGLAVPPATVHRVLLRQGLVRIEDRRSPALKRFEREQPNQLWQMDFKSPKGWQQAVGPLSVIDDASRYAVVLANTGSTRAEGVRTHLERAFTDCGLPDAMLMDHGTPWWNMASAGGWTQLSVWLMKQNIRLLFSGYRHPQTQGKVERFHGALERARWRRGGLPEPSLRQLWLDNFRQEYNHLRPHEALDMQTPASLWRPSLRAYVADPVWQYPEGAEVRRLERTGQLKLDGRRWQMCGALAGEPVQITRLDQRVLVFFRHTLLREIDLASQGSTIVEP